MRQRSNMSSPSGCGALITCAPAKRRPGLSAGTTNAEIPLAPFDGSVEANTVYMSAMPAFEMKAFRPSRTHSLPSSVAVVVIEPTSDPASGSVIAKPHITRPPSMSGSQFRCISSFVLRRIGNEPSACRAYTSSASGE